MQQAHSIQMRYDVVTLDDAAFSSKVHQHVCKALSQLGYVATKAAAAATAASIALTNEKDLVRYACNFIKVHIT